MPILRLLEIGRGQNELAAHLETLERRLYIPPEVDEQCLPGLAVVPSSFPPALRKRLLSFDGNIFYPETFTEKQLLKELPGIPAAILQAEAEEIGLTKDEILELEPNFVAQKIAQRVAGAVSSLQALFRAVRSDRPEEHVPAPSKYFAVLKMDGDRMGAFFSRASEDLAQHLSLRLSQFAHQEAPAIVARYSGRLVYAGGDDAMAILPILDVLPCASTLQKAFESAVNSMELSAHATPTLSTGIAIAHYTDPLDSVLLTVQRAEKTAKDQYNRDAVCIHVLKRSGEELRIGAHWRYDGLDTLALMGRLIDAFQKGIISMRFAQAVAGEAKALTSHRVPAEARASTLKRLARRHGADGQQAMAVTLVTDLAKWAEGQDTRDAKPLGLDEVASWVLLARFIANGGRDE